MDLQAEKELIKSDLENVDDIHLLRAIKHILASGKSQKHEENRSPMTKEMLYKRNELSRKAIEEDTLISHEEAKKYFVRKND